jgi:hypothetical protein
MILSLLGSAGARYWADDRRAIANPTEGAQSSTTSLASMDSYALGLLLGGLRGPLVMFLWSQSENQKSDKDLEGLETEIEWIRLLQPEFDTVHLFQIWNKAYNISVQMASLANKYDVILGALDYAHSVDDAKPDDINIVAAFGQLYFDKLGTSSEKEYYRKRVREETLPHLVVQNSKRDPGWRRMQLDPVVDSSFNVLPDLCKAKAGMERPANIPADQEWDDGSAMQYLPRFQPYPDGVSTFALAYSYYKRAEVLQNVQKQRHDQWSDLVVDSRPALSLKNWGEDELEQGHRRETQAFANIPLAPDVNPDDPDQLGLASAGVALNQKVKDAHDIQLAIADFEHAMKVLPECLVEYDRHIKNFPDRENQYQSYMHEVRAEIQLAIADDEFLTAMVCPPAERDHHLARANAAYIECRHQAYINILRYYTNQQILKQVLPEGFGIERTGEHKVIEDLSLDQALEALNKATDIGKTAKKNPFPDTDRAEFDRFIRRCLAREQAIRATSNTPGT